MRTLREWRRERLMSLAELATAAEKTLGNIERGDTIPRLGTIRKITGALNFAAC